MDVKGLSEQLIVLRCQAGDEGAFEELFRRYGEHTHRYLSSVVGAAAADDLQQDAWITVYQHISSLANPSGFRAWLFQVVRSRLLDALRRGWRDREILEALRHEADGDSHVSAETEGDLGVDEEDIARALAQLSPEHREVLVLRFWEGLSYSEIALVTRVPPGTVRSRLFHAKRLIHHFLEPGT